MSGIGSAVNIALNLPDFPLATSTSCKLSMNLGLRSSSTVWTVKYPSVMSSPSLLENEHVYTPSSSMIILLNSILKCSPLLSILTRSPLRRGFPSLNHLASALGKLVASTSNRIVWVSYTVLSASVVLMMWGGANRKTIGDQKPFRMVKRIGELCVEWSKRSFLSLPCISLRLPLLCYFISS